MKKLIVLCLIVVMLLSGCKKADMVNGAKDGMSMFVIVEETSSWRIVYHRESKVMYAVSDSSYNCGNFTLLVDAEGKPLLYEGDKE